MSTKAESIQSVHSESTSESKSLWSHAWDELKKDKIAILSLITVTLYILVAILSAFGVIASGWNEEVGAAYAQPSTEHWFGLDIFGRSFSSLVIKGAEIAITVGFFSSIFSTFIGLVLGSLAGYFGGKIDEAIVWLYTTFSSIPWIILLMGINFVLGSGFVTVIIALSVTSWVGICRIVRGEILRHKEREYVHAATSIGGGHARKLFKHIIPNLNHILIINFSLMFQTAIKSEVILAYLGLGVIDKPSWGRLINSGKEELLRSPAVFGGVLGASLAMFFIVLAFNLLGDALRDALDPKLKGKS